MALVRCVYIAAAGRAVATPDSLGDDASFEAVFRPGSQCVDRIRHPARCACSAAAVPAGTDQSRLTAIPTPTPFLARRDQRCSGSVTRKASIQPLQTAGIAVIPVPDLNPSVFAWCFKAMQCTLAFADLTSYQTKTWNNLDRFRSDLGGAARFV
jgi:hypothetical protein